MILEDVDFSREHILGMNPSEAAQADFEHYGMDEIFETFESATVAMTAMAWQVGRSVPMYCWAVDLSEEGRFGSKVGTLSTVFSADCKKHWLSILKYNKRCLESFMTSAKVHRMQSIVPLGNHHVGKYNEFLGFRVEGVLKAFDKDKRDYWLFAKVV
jgi:hypothetical protein